jgi:tellurite resistance protein TerC
MKRVARMVMGGTLLVVGVAMLVLPGPAFIMIPLGLTILAVDFPWARALMRKARTWFAEKRRPRPGSL